MQALKTRTKTEQQKSVNKYRKSDTNRSFLYLTKPELLLQLCANSMEEKLNFGYWFEDHDFSGKTIRQKDLFSTFNFGQSQGLSLQKYLKPSIMLLGARNQL